MKTRMLLLVPLLLLVGLVGGGLGATYVTSSVTMTKLPNLTVTAQLSTSSTATVEASPTGTTSSKKAFVYKWTIAGVDRFVLVRVQTTSAGVFLDLVADANITSLSQTVAAMSLSTSNHPTPAKDATDTAAMVAAGGS